TGLLQVLGLAKVKGSRLEAELRCCVQRRQCLAGLLCSGLLARQRLSDGVRENQPQFVGNRADLLALVRGEMPLVLQSPRRPSFLDCEDRHCLGSRRLCLLDIAGHVDAREQRAVIVGPIAELEKMPEIALCEIMYFLLMDFLLNLL